MLNKEDFKEQSDLKHYYNNNPDKYFVFVESGLNTSYYTKELKEIDKNDLHLYDYVKVRNPNPDDIPVVREIKQKEIPIKHYTYSFEFPDISKIEKGERERVYYDILNTFEKQLNEWLI